MQDPDHPARKPTRYHWAAGTNPLHWLPALCGWVGAGLLGSLAGAGQEWAGPGAGLAALAALGWSGVWLLVLPITPRFKRSVDANLAGLYENDYSYQYSGLVGRINPNLHSRAGDITRLRDKAREILTGKFGDHDPFAKDNLEKLDRLAISYLQLLASLSEYDEYLSLVNPQSIEDQLKDEEEKHAASSGDIHTTQERTISLLKNRLDRYNKAKQRVELIKAQCKSLDTTMKLLVDQAMVAADPKRVGRDIDQVLHNIKESEILTADLAAFDELEREIDAGRLKSGE